MQFQKTTFGTASVGNTTGAGTDWKTMAVFRDADGPLMVEHRASGVFHTLEETTGPMVGYQVKDVILEMEPAWRCGWTRIPESAWTTPAVFGSGPENHLGDWDLAFFAGWGLLLPTYTEGQCRSYREGTGVLTLRTAGCPEAILRGLVEAMARKDRLGPEKVEALLRGESVWKN